MKKSFLISVILFLTSAVIAYAGDSAPRYIFMFIGDGMGNGHVMSANAYERMVRGNADGLLMTTFPVFSQAVTYSASSPVTDSAAAGTAIATSVKTLNGMVGMDPDSVPVRSIARKLADKGFGVGIVTSVAADDATPAAFYASAPYRKESYMIDSQWPASGFDFLAGAGLYGLADKEGKPTDIVRKFADAGYPIVHSIDSIPTRKRSKAVLLSPATERPWNIGYTIDSLPGALTLPDMTRAGLDLLRRNGHERFFMMVEGGNIDHAAHANDGGAVIKEILKFDDAIRVAYDFYTEHPEETLIVITADHDTGGMSLGNATLHYDAKPWMVDCQRISKERFSDECKALLASRRAMNWEEMQGYLTDKLGLFGPVEVTPEQEAKLREVFDIVFVQGRGEDIESLYNKFNPFAAEAFKVFNDNAGFGFTTGYHTGNMVPLIAIGAGAERFGKLTDNTEISKNILELVR